MLRISGLLVLVLLLGACTGTKQSTAPLNTQCSDPRPQVCTMEYAPVCAGLKAGGSAEYASGCNACADDAVTGYLPGACPESGA
jgi:hypothetical protein